MTNMKNIKNNHNDAGDVLALDNRIKHNIRTLETDIPPLLEESFLNQLAQTEPISRGGEKRRMILMGITAAAASILMTVMLYLFAALGGVDVKDTNTLHAEEKTVYVENAQMDGRHAETYLVGSDDPNTTIVWVEKTTE